MTVHNKQEWKEYEVVWRIEVSAKSAEDAAEHVDDLYLQECEGGNWVYEIITPDSNIVLLEVEGGKAQRWPNNAIR